MNIYYLKLIKYNLKSDTVKVKNQSMFDMIKENQIRYR